MDKVRRGVAEFKKRLIEHVLHVSVINRQCIFFVCEKLAVDRLQVCSAG